MRRRYRGPSRTRPLDAGSCYAEPARLWSCPSNRLLDSGDLSRPTPLKLRSPMLADPRSFPMSSMAAGPTAARWHAWVDEALSGATGQERSLAGERLHAELGAALTRRDADAIRGAFATAPSAICWRQLARALDAAWRDPRVDGDATLVAHGFALPIVIVAAAPSETEQALVLPDPAAVIALVAQSAALAGNARIAIANALTGIGAVGLDALEHWLASRADPTAAAVHREIPHAPLALSANGEGAHLRFIAGAALAAPGAGLLTDDAVGGAWANELARRLSADLAAPGVSLLALPRSPLPPLAAARAGRLAHREIALQLYASNAIRAMRASVGEPSAVISAHRTLEGEIRVSLSSPFGAREAEGFRCPLFPFERVEDVVAVIADLLRACRVADVRVQDGLHPDRDPGTGLPLFFRADALGSAGPAPLH